ncbi:leucine-rich_repeat domain-containing protein [Hexamita inflata]|uniref:Leucine-rich repeat domain-containing protein n=1 Tax=Hexamita inflata TaxID=28002 RepID=A0AA86N486_9EUKA|nr:leucine-rich repeat domain-containing protein [Hexamita inflata]
MILKFGEQILDNVLKIQDPEVTNLKFIEKLNVQTLELCISNGMNVKFRNNIIKELELIEMKVELNWIIDDLELENLKMLMIIGQRIDEQIIIKDTEQFKNIAKFKKLHTLILVSTYNVDLTHIYYVTSLTKLSMEQCGLKNIDLIKQLVNLEDLDLQMNNLQQIDSMRYLVNLKELNISQNWQIDITPLEDLVNLIKLMMSSCELRSLSPLKLLSHNLQYLDISNNDKINITELQFLTSLIYLNFENCKIFSICALRPLVNLEILDIAYNNIVYLDANLNNMKKLEWLQFKGNIISDFTSIENYIISNNNNAEKSEDIQFQIYSQRKFKDLQEKGLRFPNKLRRIEGPNILLIQIQNQRKTHKMAQNNLKQEINAAVNNTRQNQIQFTSTAVRLFQQLNQMGFE